MSTTTLWSDVMNQACPSIYPDPGLGPSFTRTPLWVKTLTLRWKSPGFKLVWDFTHTYIQNPTSPRSPFIALLSSLAKTNAIFVCIVFNFDQFWIFLVCFFFFAHFKKQANKTTILLWPQWHGPSSWIALWRLAHKSRCRSPPRWTGLLPLLDTAETTFQTLCFKYFSDSNVKTIQNTNALTTWRLSASCSNSELLCDT